MNIENIWRSLSSDFYSDLRYKLKHNVRERFGIGPQKENTKLQKNIM